jgi:polysaccharide transporter, PST family
LIAFKKNIFSNDFTSNTLWLLVDKFIRAGGTFVLTAWMAKTIGVSDFGIWSYAVAFISIFTIFSSLGIKEIVIKEAVKDENNLLLFGSAFFLRILGGLFAMIGSVVAIFFMNGTENLTFKLVSILSITIVIQATEVIDYYFQSILKSKFTVLARNIPFIFTSLIKVYFILDHYSIEYFAFVTVFETMLSSLLLVYFLRKTNINILEWKIKQDKTIQLLKDSFPLLLAGIAVIIYMRIDQIMLKEMVGNIETGKFSVAVILSEILYTLPTIVSISALPILIKSKQNSTNEYYSKIKQLCDYLTFTAVIVIIGIVICSKWIVSIFFGKEFLSAAPIFAIHSLSSLFVFQGFLVNNWLVAENLQKYSLYRYATGALVNVILNYFFIPIWGAIGCAYATVISQSIASYFSNCFTKNTMPIFIIQSKSFFDVLTLKFIYNFSRKIN